MGLTPLMGIIGMILPAIIGTLTKDEYDKKARFWISFGCCFVFGLGVWAIDTNGVISGTWNQIANSIASTILLMTGIVKISYEAFWDNRHVSKVVPDAVLDNESPLRAMGLKPPGR
jgi:hypothetical protein